MQTQNVYKRPSKNVNVFMSVQNCQEGGGGGYGSVAKIYIHVKSSC